MSQAEDKEIKKLKDFAKVMALALIVLGGVAYYKLNPLTIFFFLTALLFLTLGFFAPKALTPLEKYWMIFAEKLSIISTFVLVLISFFLILTPIAIILKILKKDPLKKGADKTKDSYWEDITEENRRYYLPY